MTEERKKTEEFHYFGYSDGTWTITDTHPHGTMEANGICTRSSQKLIEIFYDRHPKKFSFPILIEYHYLKKHWNWLKFKNIINDYCEILEIRDIIQLQKFFDERYYHEREWYHIWELGHLTISDLKTLIIKKNTDNINDMGTE